MKQQHVWGIAIMLGVFIPTLTFGLCHPFRALELFLRLYAIALPITLIAIFAAGAASSRTTAQESEMMTQVITPSPMRLPGRTVLIMSLPVAAVLVSGAIAANTYYDTAPATPLTAKILRKYVSHGRRSGTHYNAAIASPVPSPLPFEFSGTETLSLRSGDYNSVIPGQTTAVLQVHPGYLGFPWYEKNFRLVTAPSW